MRSCALFGICRCVFVIDVVASLLFSFIRPVETRSYFGYSVEASVPMHTPMFCCFELSSCRHECHKYWWPTWHGPNTTNVFSPKKSKTIGVFWFDIALERMTSFDCKASRRLTQIWPNVVVQCKRRRFRHVVCRSNALFASFGTWRYVKAAFFQFSTGRKVTEPFIENDK